MVNRLIDFRVTLLFGVPSVVGVLIARKIIFPSIPEQLISSGSFVLSKDILFMLCLSILMFVAATKMLKGNSANEPLDLDRPRKTGLLLLQGLVVGMVTGLLGIGGGFLIVPALYFWAKLPMKLAIGTTLLIIAINSLFSFLASYASVCIDWSLLLKFSSGAVLGILAGIKLSSKISSAYLKKIFGCFVMCVAFYTIYKQFIL